VKSTNYTINTYKKLAGIIGAAAVLLFPFFVMQLNTGNAWLHKQSLCPFKLLTGFPCPGCGITKSMICIYKGDWIDSFQYHIFGPFVFLSCILLIGLLIAEISTKKEFFKNIIYNQKLAVIMCVVLIIYHIIRVVYFVSENSFEDILRESMWR
jgi:hypothetical protein